MGDVSRYIQISFGRGDAIASYSRLSGGQKISVLTPISVLKEEKDEAGNNADGKMTKSLPGRCNLTSVIGHPTAAELTYKHCTRMSKK